MGSYHIKTENKGWHNWIATFDGHDGSSDATGRDALIGLGDTEGDAIVDLISEEGALESDV